MHRHDTMNNTPLVSIALATWNGEKFLAKQLDSLISQDYPELEIVISDDCSTDRTWEILKSYAKKDHRIRLLPQEFNRGYVKNFFRAFTECEGNLISPCDQDDIWDPKKTTRLVTELKDAALIYCDSQFISENDTPLDQNVFGRRYGKKIQGSNPENFIFSNSICGHAMLFRKYLIKNLNNLDDTPYIDWRIAFHAAETGRIQYLNETLVNWRQHTSSFTSHTRIKTDGGLRKSLENERRNLKFFSETPGKHQQLAIDARQRWEKWHSSYLNFSMLIFVLRYGRVTHLAHPARCPALKYLAGHRLKKLLRPSYY